MTGMEHAIEQAARLIDPDGWRLRDSGTLPLDHPGAQAVVRRSMETARALAEGGLLAPVPLTEEWHAAYYGTTRDGVRHLRLIGTEGSREHADDTRADCAQDDPDTRFFLVRRPVHAWEPVDRAEGDGSADQ